MNKYDLVVIGDLLADIIVPVNKLPLFPGDLGWADGLSTELGGGGTTLVAARRCGLTAAPLAVLGDDEYGRQVVQMLVDEDVDVSHIEHTAARQTVACLVVTDQAGQHLFINFNNESRPQRCPPAWREVVARAHCLLTTGYTLRYFLHADDVLELLKIGRHRSAQIFFDPGPTIADLEPHLLAEVLAITDVLLLTHEEAQTLADGNELDVANALRALGPSVVVLKAGADGCYVSTADESFHQPGFDVAVLDTVGAGDAFAAAFIAGYQQGANLRKCATLGNAMGAAVVGTVGAGRRVPELAQIVQIAEVDSASLLPPSSHTHKL